jgi:dienelactone hydrolase
MAFSRIKRTSERKKLILGSAITLVVLLSLTIGVIGGWMLRENYRNDPLFFSPFLESVQQAKRMPLQKYAIPQLAEQTIPPSEIRIQSVIDDNPDFTSYLFSYETYGGKMTGQLNVPQSTREQIDGKNAVLPAPVIVMLRGYYPLPSYTTGGGTRNAAAALAKAGFITIAPDFLGYGDSDPEFEDSWEARFAKPAQILQLLETLSQVGLPLRNTLNQTVSVSVNANQVGMWAHSNGGQIALSVLQIYSKPIPTTLWAPVTAPFPYSVLYFGLEQADEGKSQRKWLAQFEETYDVYDFSISRHMDRLTGPIQLHHGTADEAAPIAWSDTFENWVNAENERRKRLLEKSAAQTALKTESTIKTKTGIKAESTIESETTIATQPATVGELNQKLLPPINLTYYRYPGVDHNMRPSWDQVVQQDISFFREQLSL